MSETPRTDAEADNGGGGHVVTASFARTLERELTAALTREARFREAWERIVATDQKEFRYKASEYYVSEVHRAVQETRKSLSFAALAATKEEEV